MQPCATPSPSSNASARLNSLDAYRGFVMLLMASGGLGLGHLASSFPQSPFLQFLAYQTDHVAWLGCTLWDLIQPSFTFMVGVALPFSIASRVAKGDTFYRLLAHALGRSVILVLLGVFLRSTHHSQTMWTFEDTLSQIGLGYTFLFLLGWVKPRIQWITLVLVLFFYWLAFALYPLPSATFDYASVGVPANWPHLQGFAAHWDKNTNIAAHFETWFLNLFPRSKPFLFNGGGYLTLSFIPTLATMICGLLMGQLIRSGMANITKLQKMIVTGIVCLAMGQILDMTGVAPVVKKIWTPGWVIFSTGWCCLLMAFFYHTIELKNYRAWAFPLVVVGMNSIVIYSLAHLIGGFIINSFQIHLGPHFFKLFGDPWSGMFRSVAELTVLWLILHWMYRRKIFLKF